MKNLILNVLFILILSHSLALKAQTNIKFGNDRTICVEDVQDMGHLNFLTWSAKEILDFLARSEFLKEKEWKTIEENPALLIHLKKAADLALKISEETCPYNPQGSNQGVYASDDEVDALRHFVMSSYLSMKLGRKTAMRFMAAHENSEFEDANMMDYYNNELGFNYGEKLREDYKDLPFLSREVTSFIKDIKTEIQRRHQMRRGNPEDFLVLTSGPSVCAQSKYPNF